MIVNIIALLAMACVVLYFTVFTSCSLYGTPFALFIFIISQILLYGDFSIATEEIFSHVSLNKFDIDVY